MPYSRFLKSDIHKLLERLQVYMDEIWDRQIEADLVSGKLDHLIDRAEAEILKKRLDRNRPMVSVTIRMPEDVIEDLKQMAPLLGFSGYQPLVRAYIGQGLRADLERSEGDTVSALIASLQRRGVSNEIIQEALGEVTQH